MTLNQYQRRARVYMQGNVKNDALYLALGLGGEVGEVLEKIKKEIRDGIFEKKALQKELGDVLWYLSQLSYAYDFDFEDVAKANLSKLQSRYKRGTIGGEGDNR